MPGAQKIEKVGHIHECIINEMLLEPTITQKQLCEMFGYTPGWMSRLINSDSFQARLAARRQELMDPDIKARLNDRLKGAVMQSVNVIQQRLQEAPEKNAELALQSLGVFTEALGMLTPAKK